MHKRLSVLFINLVLVACPVMADKDIDQNEAQALHEKGTILSLEDILQNVQKTKPGRVIKVELEKKHGRYIYEIEIADAGGQVWELKIDASDGILISQEQDN